MAWSAQRHYQLSITYWKTRLFVFTLIQNGDLYAPEPLGRHSILLARGKIVKVGGVDEATLKEDDMSYTVVDARGNYVVPGFIDPHAHINGVPGSAGTGGRTLPISMAHLVRNGITTVVGSPSVSDTPADVPALLGRAYRLSGEGLNVYSYTGGVHWPLNGDTLRAVNDLVRIDKVIGVGGVPLPDGVYQSTSVELARLVSEASAHGLQSGKAGVVQFRPRPDESDLRSLHDVLDSFPVPAKSIYPTNTNNSRSLFDDAIRLTVRGAYADISANGHGLTEWLDYYIKMGGEPSHLTVSSGAHAEDIPISLYRHFADSVRNYGLPLECVLPFFTQNTASALNLKSKGWLGVGADADLLIINRDTLELEHVFAMGRHLLKQGRVVSKDAAS